MLAIVLLPAALTYTFGRMAGRTRHGWLLFWVMAVLFAAGLLLNDWAERKGNPLMARAMNAPTSAADPSGAIGGNMEGKEARFGVGGSALTAIATSNGATGSYNSMHDSFTPLGGMVPLVNMLLGEITFGGLGTGLVSMMLVSLLAIFLTGLMVGRTPAYMGKSVGPPEMKMIVLYWIFGPVAVLLPTAVAVVAAPGLAGLTTNSGSHGFTEILYAFSSAFGNNGQNFAGLSANAPFYNVATGIAMIIGRFALVIT